MSYLIWAGIMVAFVVVEIATPQLISIWFALGALGAMIASYFKAALWIQLVVFVAVATVMLFATRPLYRKYLKTKQIPTNADRLVGQTAVVSEAIDNLNAKGAVKISGQEWSARSLNGARIPLDTKVTVTAIDGAKLIVK